MHWREAVLGEPNRLVAVAQQVPCVRANLSNRPPPWADRLQGCRSKTYAASRSQLLLGILILDRSCSQVNLNKMNLPSIDPSKTQLLEKSTLIA